MSKEHSTLTEFFNFLAAKPNHLQQDAEEVIQDYYNFRAERIAKEKEEKRIKQLKKLELIVQKREAQQAKNLKPKMQRISLPKKPTEQKTINKKSKINTMSEMRKLIDRIRN
ncbi:hypothetical protein [Labilibaculum sp.]|uniref:hypothetical protein n=1 Tax=Labilibaculum sp. TaxID=2060723 RepID=UPI002AA885F5|nr:hypothetical protein [Labilibaculum sp.]